MSFSGRRSSLSTKHRNSPRAASSAWLRDAPDFLLALFVITFTRSSRFA